MGVRFDADNELYTASPASAAYTDMTLACWARIDVDRNDYATFVCVDDGTTGGVATLQAGFDGTTLIYSDANVEAGNIALTPGTWYAIAVAKSGTTGTLYVRAVGAATWTTAALSGLMSSLTINTIRLGETAHGSDWLNGSIAGVKVWLGAQLTQAELDAEFGQLMPVRTANLTAWYPLLVAETADYSGQGNNLTGGTGAASTDTPGVPWRGALRPQYFTTAAAGAALTVSATDSAGAADAVTAALAYGRAQTDTAGLTDAVSVAVAREVTTLDPGGLTDSATLVVAYVRTVDDSTGLIDAAVAATGYSRTAADPAGLTDAAASALAYGRTATDSAGLADTAVTAAAYARTATDPAGLTDTVLTVMQFVRTVDDSAGLADTVTVSLAQTLTITDLVGLSDDATGGLLTGLDQDRTDLLVLTDSVRTRLTTHRPLAGTTSRPNSGATSRPFAGTTVRP